MKKINIFGLPSHQTKERTSGVDFARIIQPLKHLDGYKGIHTMIYDPLVDEKHNNPLEYDEIMKNNGIFYFNYLNNPWGFAAFGVMARKYGVKIVMDIDDDIWDIHPDNSAYQTYHKGSVALNNFTAICNEVDYITTTNSYLKNVILNHTYKRPDKIKVIPNYVDLSLYKYRPPFKDTMNIQLLHFGSTTHFIDLQSEEFFKGVNQIMKEYPNVTFRTVGAFIPKFRQAWGPRYENVFGHVDIYEWIQNPEKFPKIISESDILVVPLTDDIYNRCKSQIKWLEASSASKPGVWQKIRQYEEVIENGKNGFVAQRSDDWYNSIKKLIDDKQLRYQMGNQTFKDVKDWQIQDHLDEYADFFREILDK